MSCVLAVVLLLVFSRRGSSLLYVDQRAAALAREAAEAAKADESAETDETTEADETSEE